ncbi:NAD-binding protein [Pluteus cervinus]|uniref:NAD-binding protein n=1 Tax=Pluteus cervinus TaxID=181527 RepID=A0ACD3AGE1_9AGAR|nr:NAD-binding protein [Pluteus cervinus]
MSSTSTSAPAATRVAIVTGASQGIGRAIAIRLASDGLDVAVNDIPSKQSQLEEIVKEIQTLGRQGLVIPGDVSKEEDVIAMVEKTVEKFGRLDVMIANAGVAGGGLLLDTEISAWESVFDVNIRGVILCYKYAAKQMVKQGFGGRIIGASSICGLNGYAGLGAYCISKASVRSLTQTVSLELSPYNITVNAYAPGIIQTEMSAITCLTSFNMSTLDFHLSPLTVLSHVSYNHRQIMKIPDAKVGQPTAVASLVSYLVSPEAHFTTGQTISMNGGAVFN